LLHHNEWLDSKYIDSDAKCLLKCTNS